MRVSREPEDTPPLSRGLRARSAKTTADPPVERLVEDALDAVEHGDSGRAEGLLDRVLQGLNVSGLTNYLDEKIRAIAESGRMRDVCAIAFTTLAASRERKGDLPGAIDALEDAFALVPRPEVLSSLVRLTALVHGPEQALAMLDDRSADWPEDAGLLAQAAVLVLDLGQLSRARQLVTEALANDPAHVEALAVQARLAITENQFAAALGPARRVIASQPSRGRALVALALDGLGRAAEDLGLITAVLADLPADTWLLKRFARLLRDSQRLDDSARVLTHALQLAPDDIEARQDRGYVYALLGRLEEAAADLDEAVTADDEPDLIALRAEVARLLGDLQTAVRLFRSLAPDEAPPWVGSALGDTLSAMADDAGAKEAYLVALDRGDHDIQALTGLALLALSEGTASADQEARELLGRAVSIDPADARVHAYLGEVLRRDGDEHGAIDEFDRALELDPDYTWAEASKGQALLALDQYGAGIQALLKAAERTPEEDWILDELVTALSNHSPTTAERELRKLQRRVREANGDDHRKIFPICARRAQLAHRQERWEDADLLFNQARETVPEDRDLAADHVDVLRHLGRLTEALTIVNQLDRSDPGSSLARVRIDLLWSLGRLIEARDELETMRRQGTATTQALAALGECYRLEGRRAEALDLLTSADEAEPGQPYVLASLGALELDRDDPEAARAHLEDALLRMPRYEFALDRLVALELSQGNGAAVQAIVEMLDRERNPELVAVRVTALYELGDYVRAADALDAHFEEGGGNADLIRLRGWTALALGQRREAARNFSLAARTEAPTSQLVQSVLSLVRVGLWAEARAALRRAGTDPAADTAAAELDFRIGSWESAVERGRRGRARGAMPVAAATIESRALRMLGRLDEALDAARLVQDLRPAQPWSIANLGECLQATEQTDEAELAFSEALERLDRRAHRHSDDTQLKGMCLLRLGRFREAGGVFLQSLTTTDQSAKALFNLLLASLGDGELLQSEVLANRITEEVNILSAPTLRGALATASYELSLIAPQLSEQAAYIAHELQLRVEDALSQLPSDLDALLRSQERPPIPSLASWAP